MSSRSLSPVFASVVVIAFAVVALPAAVAEEGEPRVLEGKSAIVRAEGCDVQPGPVSQAAEWAHCQTNYAVDAAVEYTCGMLGC